MTTADSKVQLHGEAVTVSYVADPVIGHAQFRLENRGANPIVASVESGWIDIGGHRRALEGVTVFDVDTGRMLDVKAITVEGRSVMKFLLGFAQLTEPPAFGQNVRVGLQLSTNDVLLEAESPIEIVRRIPRV